MKKDSKYDLQSRLVKFSALIILNVNSLKKNYASDHLAKQLIRSATSAALNYGEAQGAESKKDFIHKMRVCLKELRESQVNLQILEEAGLIIDNKTFNLILFDLIIVGFLSIITSIFLTRKKAKRDHENVWDLTIKRMVYSFLTTLIAGGIYITIIISKQDYEQAGALMLIFYGLAIINGAKHTLKDVRFLGYIEVLLGLIFALFPAYGFWIWVLGFGVLHIVYGSIMYFKHEKNNYSYKS